MLLPIFAVVMVIFVFCWRHLVKTKKMMNVVCFCWSVLCTLSSGNDKQEVNLTMLMSTSWEAIFVNLPILLWWCPQVSISWNKLPIWWDGHLAYLPYLPGIQRGDVTFFRVTERSWKKKKCWLFVGQNNKKKWENFEHEWLKKLQNITTFCS